MAKETIRDFGGRIMGTIEDMGGKKVARDFYGRILGTYDYGDGKTRDFHGRIIANGSSPNCGVNCSSCIFVYAASSNAC